MTDVMRMLTPEVLIIGGGPAGLTAAAHLAGCVHGDVLVLDREKQAGGIPRHSDHLGYGIRDMRRVISGPAYAQRLVRAAETAGAVIHTQAMVTGWDGDGNAQVTSPQGRLAIHAKAVVLATGARERPRTARLIPGDRPGGVYTTGQLQNLVHLHHGVPGQRAVVVGGELVSWSAVVTLREAGARTVLMTTQYPSPESYAAFNIGGKLALRVPVAARTRVVRVMGRPRVEAIEIENLDSGDRRVVECDTVVFTGDWIPDHELARLAGLRSRPRNGGPADRHRAADQPARNVRRRQPAPSCRHRRHCRAGRAARRGSGQGLAGRAAPGRDGRSVFAPRNRSGGSLQGCCGPATRRHPGGGCCCGRTTSSACRVSRPSRTGGSSACEGCPGPPHQAGSSASRGLC